MKRAIAISLARLAGYHEDRRRFTRLLVEARVARPKLLAAWADGERARAAGVACTCRDCATGSAS